jgi:hypothetical protein
MAWSSRAVLIVGKSAWNISEMHERGDPSSEPDPQPGEYDEGKMKLYEEMMHIRDRSSTSIMEAGVIGAAGGGNLNINEANKTQTGKIPGSQERRSSTPDDS